LQAALNAATAGSVIEVSGTIGTSSVQPILTGGNLSWPIKVLIRPPLGQRGTVEQLQVYANNVVMAGWDIDLNTRIGSAGTSPTIEGNGSYLWRCTTKSGSFLVTGASNSGLVECVSAVRGYNWLADKADLYAYERAMGPTLVDGCYIASVVRLQDVTAVPLLDIQLTDPIQTGQRVASFTYSGASSYVLTHANFLIGHVDTSGQLVLSVKVNGTEQFQLNSSDTAPYYDYAKRDMGAGGQPASVTVNNGDVVAVDVVTISGLISAVSLVLSKPSPAHLDCLQWEVISGGSYTGPWTITNNVLLGSSNSAVQVPNVADGVLPAGIAYRNNWVLNEAYTVQNIEVPVTAAGVMNVMDYNVIARGEIVGVSGWSYYGNKATSLGGSTSFVDTSKNSIGAFPTVIPPVPDLASAWRDCPYTGDPTAP
jgi:hypothetical protein